MADGDTHELIAGEQPLERRIIYRAFVRLVVNDFGDIEQQILQLVQSHQGYLASATIDRQTGRQRTGKWVARVPVDQYREFMQRVVDLGNLENRDETSQDVTEEFVDLEARLANQRELERRILQLLDRSTDELSDIIQVERELARIREQIERMEGRLRYLQNATSLTTVEIAAREQRDYVPPQSPTLNNRVATAWNGSLRALVRSAEALLVTSAAATPWLVIVAIPVAGAVITARRLRRRSGR